MIPEEGTYDDFKLCIFAVLDYNAVLTSVHAYIAEANYDGCVLNFRGEQAGGSIAVLWFDYKFMVMYPVEGVRATFRRLAEKMNSQLAEFHTETAVVVSASEDVDLKPVEMAPLHQTRAGQVGWAMPCPSDYCPLLRYKPSGSAIEPMRVDLVVSLLEAQKRVARQSGGNEHANFAAQSVISTLRLQGQVACELETDAEMDEYDEPPPQPERRTLPHLRRG